MLHLVLMCFFLSSTVGTQVAALRKEVARVHNKVRVNMSCVLF